MELITLGDADGFLWAGGTFSEREPKAWCLPDRYWIMHGKFHHKSPASIVFAIVLLTVFWLKTNCTFVYFGHCSVKISLHLPVRKCDLFVKWERQQCHRNDWNLQKGTCWWGVKQLRWQLGVLFFCLKGKSGSSWEWQTTVSGELLWKRRDIFWLTCHDFLD